MKRVRVLAGEDAGRIGTVIEPSASAAGLAGLPGVPGLELLSGKPGHLIVVLDAENGQVARGGRGGKRVLVPTDAVGDLVALADMPDAAATAQIKAEHDHALDACLRIATNAVIVAGAHVKEGTVVESQQVYIARLRKLRQLIIDLSRQPID